MLGVEKLITSKMLVKGSNKRIFNVDFHVGMVRSFSRTFNQSCVLVESVFWSDIFKIKRLKCAYLSLHCLLYLVFSSFSSCIIIAHSSSPHSHYHHFAIQALAGLAADARQVANKAREEAQNYRSFYGVPIPGSLLADRIG